MGYYISANCDPLDAIIFLHTACQCASLIRPRGEQFISWLTQVIFPFNNESWKCPGQGVLLLVMHNQVPMINYENVCGFPRSASHSWVAYTFIWHTHTHTHTKCVWSKPMQTEGFPPLLCHRGDPRGTRSPDSCGWRWPRPVWVAAAGG